MFEGNPFHKLWDHIAPKLARWIARRKQAKVQQSAAPTIRVTPAPPKPEEVMEEEVHKRFPTVVLVNWLAAFVIGFILVMMLSSINITVPSLSGRTIWLIVGIAALVLISGIAIAFMRTGRKARKAAAEVEEEETEVEPEVKTKTSSVAAATKIGWPSLKTVLILAVLALLVIKGGPVWRWVVGPEGETTLVVTKNWTPIRVPLGYAVSVQRNQEIAFQERINDDPQIYNFGRVNPKHRAFPNILKVMWLRVDPNESTDRLEFTVSTTRAN